MFYITLQLTLRDVIAFTITTAVTTRNVVAGVALNDVIPEGTSNDE